MSLPLSFSARLIPSDPLSLSWLCLRLEIRSCVRYAIIMARSTDPLCIHLQLLSDHRRALPDAAAIPIEVVTKLIAQNTSDGDPDLLVMVSNLLSHPQPSPVPLT